MGSLGLDPLTPLWSLLFRSVKLLPSSTTRCSEGIGENARREQMFRKDTGRHGVLDQGDPGVRAQVGRSDRNRKRSATQGRGMEDSCGHHGDGTAVEMGFTDRDRNGLATTQNWLLSLLKSIRLAQTRYCAGDIIFPNITTPKSGHPTAILCITLLKPRKT